MGRHASQNNFKIVHSFFMLPVQTATSVTKFEIINQGHSKLLNILNWGETEKYVNQDSGCVVQ